ncbi:aspartic peptidase domain-containing protein [Suillus spraguei]|nr:aspartic peptidase domain-containing protein [Suillus spraguei]
MTRRLNFSNGTNPVQRDNAQYSGIVLEMLNASPAYQLELPLPHDLVVDTESAITWVGGVTPYVPTDTGFDTKLAMKDTYESGSFTLPIGAASETEGISYDGSITRNLVSLFPAPTMNSDDGGILTFGGVETDPVFNIGNIAYTPTTTMSPSSRYWGIDQSITYGTSGAICDANTYRRQCNIPGVVDCGCTFIALPPMPIRSTRLQPGADLDPTTNLLSITPEKYGALRPLNFHIGELTCSLTPNAGIYLVVKSLNRPTASGYDFRLGYIFLQRFCSVFDTTKSLIGFATTGWTCTTTN